MSNISVLANLSSRSARSIVDSINHNCVIDGISYNSTYGVIFHMVKMTTGATFNIDIFNGDSRQIVVSEGKGFRRFEAPTEVLYALRPSVRRVMRITLELLPALLENNPDLELADLNSLPSIADATASEVKTDGERYMSAFSVRFRDAYNGTSSPEQMDELEKELFGE